MHPNNNAGAGDDNAELIMIFMYAAPQKLAFSLWQQDGWR